MFAKLLKHEWRATRGVVGLLCAIILISGVTIGGVMCYVSQPDNSKVIAAVDTNVASESDLSAFADVVCVILMMAAVIAVAVCCAGSLYYVIYRFYQRCFTEEGYLTFTLPVSNHQILLSSLTNCILSELLVAAAAFGAIAVAGGMFVLALNREIIWADLWISWEEVWQQLWQSLLKNLDQAALMGFSAAAGALGDLILLMLSVTIGALIAKKHKLMAAVGVYFGMGMVKSVVLSINLLNATTTEDVSAVLSAPGILGMGIAVAGYFLMHWLTGRKLNLT